MTDGDATVIGGNPYRALQQRKGRRDSWTGAKRTAFLDALAATCNVRMACAAAGVGRDAAYGLRRRDPVFAADWRDAIERGCEDLRAVLLARALGTADDALVAANPGPADGAPPDPEPMSDEMRLKVLQICRASADGRQGRGAWRRPPAPVRSGDDAFAALAVKLDRMEKKLKRDAQA